MDETKDVSEDTEAPALPAKYWKRGDYGSWEVALNFHFDRFGENSAQGYAPAGCTFTEAEALDLESRRHKG